MWAFDTQAADPQAGKALYNRQCANCHGSNGMPQLPGLPDFTRSEGLLRADTELKSAIQAGKGMMPAFRGLLTETQILDVIAYLRTLHR
ncbi:MAG: cytochrome c [Gammaproteobacteria bacterium]|nr:cytochrome c [Gammaproteobacteria bacterium]